MPIVVHATLIPFENIIVHDGIVTPYNITFGKNISDHAKSLYKNAKQNGTLLFSL
ncbi:MAG: hypothetical protein SPD93_01185 [Lachnospiraceae bacterium]|nr:hypothetical protein [Lachnospiraceae bacterium]